GDHTIFVGEVVGVRLSDGEPLVFYDRNYRGLSD
ncbi:MAG: flavin reductase, partial [Deltaproteobacteria bacterium]|nr:flavin reductase [Deltaproteobacteria bacterium]